MAGTPDGGTPDWGRGGEALLSGFGPILVFRVEKTRLCSGFSESPQRTYDYMKKFSVRVSL